MAKNVSKTPAPPAGEPEFIRALRREGKLREFKSMDEARAAREARKKRGIEETPAHLLPDDYFRKRKRVNTTLSTKARAIAKKIGAGNVSQGIERALLHYHANPPKRGNRV